jgi:hypothetical protein
MEEGEGDQTTNQLDHNGNGSKTQTQTSNSRQ